MEEAEGKEPALQGPSVNSPQRSLPLVAAKSRGRVRAGYLGHDRLALLLRVCADRLLPYWAALRCCSATAL